MLLDLHPLVSYMCHCCFLFTLLDPPLPGPSQGLLLDLLFPFSHMTLSLQMIMCTPAADLQLQPDYLQNYSLPLSSESHLSISAWIIHKHFKLLTSKIGDYPPQTCTFSTLLYCNQWYYVLSRCSCEKSESLPWFLRILQSSFIESTQTLSSPSETLYDG